jgi:hypothetical protein
MIWFSCPKCGKTHGRPENSIGSMVFCECGQGNSVPWESTVPEPPPQMPMLSMPALPQTPGRAPMLTPINFDPTPSMPGRVEEPLARPRRGERGERRERRDPNFCFNHASVPRSTACEDCGEPFCSSCVVTMDGATLCGPCKNFRVRGMEVPPRNSNFAISSAWISLVTGALMGFCLLPWGGSTTTGIVSMLLLLPQLFALGLGIRGLYLSEQTNRIGGQAWAITGVATASIVVALTLLMNLHGLRS